ncbi:hypothetical protein Tco_0864930 [Tanacetum coccineum]
MTAIENSHAEIKIEVSSLRQDTSDIKSMMTEIYQDFKWENVTHVATEEPPSQTKGETKDMEIENKEENPKEPKMAIPVSSVKPVETPTLKAQPITTIIPSQPESSQAPKRVDKGKRIAIDDVESQVKLVPTSRVVREDPDEPVKVPYMINGKMRYLINDEITKHLEKEELIKKAAEQARLLAITKPEVVKVVRGEAEKIGIDPERITSAKEGEKFKKDQDAEMQVHKRQHTKKVKRLTKLNKKRVENNDMRNFIVHNPFKFADFGLTELDELGLIIENKKNSIVKDLMQSLSKRYERLKNSRRTLRILSLPEGVLFVNNMVIEEPEYGIFFTNVFGDQAFQRLNDIHKVRVDSLVSYLVVALMIKTSENDRFSLKLKKLIAEHPDQEKLQSKKVNWKPLGTC